MRVDYIVNKTGSRLGAIDVIESVTLFSRQQTTEYMPILILRFNKNMFLLSLLIVLQIAEFCVDWS